MKSNQRKINLKLKAESFSTIKGFCIDALNSHCLVVKYILIPKLASRGGISVLANKLETLVHINNVGCIFIPVSVTKYPALIKILLLLHHLSIKVRFEPQLSPEQASGLPLTLLSSVIGD
jgi:hypothetical protein